MEDPSFSLRSRLPLGDDNIKEVRNMAEQTLKGMGQKMKGKVQQFTGDVKMKTNNPISGAADKVKGKVNDIAGDIRIRSDKELEDDWRN